MQQTDSAEARFTQLSAEWRSTINLLTPAEPRFAAMKAEASEVKTAGHWVSGPSDLLAILGRDRDELFHSRLLGWLLTPTGRHGLGDRFLRAFLAAAWPGETLAGSGTVLVELERQRAGASAVTGDLLEARADLVISLESAVIVIENKLDAGEQESQCDRLYWSWAGEPTDVRWVFLTPSGRPPVTAISDEARAAWRSLSYAHVRIVLSAVPRESSGSPSDTGRSSAFQYLATLTGQGDN